MGAVRAIEAPAAPLDPLTGAQLLTDLGFLHVPGRPLAPPPAYLFVALRHRPTLRHFDPERVDYWTSVAGRGVRASAARSSCPRAAEGAFAWGTIAVVDRKSVANEFVAFGGTYRVRHVNGVVIVVFSSDAPIAARGGHSQGWDPLAEEMAAFLARLRAAVGRSVAIERCINGLEPLACYSMFVADGLARHRDRSGSLVGDARVVELLRRERAALRREHPLSWASGAELAAGDG